MGSSPEVPKVADPHTTADQQQTLNTSAGQQSQRGSMTDQVTPYGNMIYKQSGTSSDGTPLYTATTTLSPAQQQQLDVLQGTQLSAGKQGQKLITGAHYGDVNPADAVGDSTKGLTQQAMQKEIAYLNPYQDYQTSLLDTKLRNQGFAPGTPGYDQAMNGLKQSQAQSVTGFEASMEPQMFQQALQTYQLPATMGEQLASWGAPTMPTFQNTPQLNIQPANLIGATANAQDAQMKAYEAQKAQSDAMMSGLFGTGSAVLGGWAKNGGVQQLGSLLGAGALAL